eukprot:1140723-Pleurochrysis_carterae.AAC.2
MPCTRASRVCYARRVALDVLRLLEHSEQELALYVRISPVHLVALLARKPEKGNQQPSKAISRFRRCAWRMDLRFGGCMGVRKKRRMEKEREPERGRRDDKRG